MDNRSAGRRIRAHHRRLHDYALAVGGKRYSYDTITSEVRGEGAWREHFGPTVWRQLCEAKRRYDPLHVLCPGVRMWEEGEATQPEEGRGGMSRM